MTALAAGLDLALNRTGICVIGQKRDVGWPPWAISAPDVVQESWPDASRIRWMADKAVASIPDGTPVAVEGQWATGNRSSILMGLQWVVRVELERKACPVVEVTNQQIRVMATGSASTRYGTADTTESRKRKARKQAIIDAMSKATGREYPGDDEAEAEALACMVMELRGLPHPMGDLRADQRRAVDKLQIPPPTVWELPTGR